MGIGASALAILLKIIPFELVWALIVLGGGILLGILWSTLGPAKKPKGDPPWRPAEQVTARPDWDAGPVPPSPPLPPDVEPLLIQPLDVEPLDIERGRGRRPPRRVAGGVSGSRRARRGSGARSAPLDGPAAATAAGSAAAPALTARRVRS